MANFPDSILVYNVISEQAKVISAAMDFVDINISPMRDRL